MRTHNTAPGFPSRTYCDISSGATGCGGNQLGQLGDWQHCEIKAFTVQLLWDICCKTIQVGSVSINNRTLVACEVQKA